MVSIRWAPRRCGCGLGPFDGGGHASDTRTCGDRGLCGCWPHTKAGTGRGTGRRQLRVVDCFKRFYSLIKWLWSWWFMINNDYDKRIMIISGQFGWPMMIMISENDYSSYSKLWSDVLDTQLLRWETYHSTDALPGWNDTTNHLRSLVFSRKYVQSISTSFSFWGAWFVAQPATMSLWI